MCMTKGNLLYEHLKSKIGEVDPLKMTEEQQRFFYFKVFDLNKDDRIDGLEILFALTHAHDDDTGEIYGGSVPDEELYVKRIDNVLRDVDSNGDGYIDYAEYTKNHMESHDKF
ncbi:unnamed protein product [Heligmosomoides polygyrus]|uniref:EF-hand domain-containing protein n=1 Tax=Heligmosomoides polygyrus TaxID=6339 RepID=A0A183F616_HELPZ|nr:unnamed protein product [Heligmosomoides polygyrus]